MCFLYSVSHAYTNHLSSFPSRHFVCLSSTQEYIRETVHLFQTSYNNIATEAFEDYDFFHKKRFFIFRTILSCSENLNCKKAFT